MLGRDKRQLDGAQRNLLPPLHFLAVREAFAEHFALKPGRHHNGCSCPVQLADGRDMQMIIVGMGDQDQVDGRDIRERNARLTDPLLEAQPPRPYRVSDDIKPFVLQKKVE